MSCPRTNQPEAGWSNKIHTQHNVPTLNNEFAAFDFGSAVSGASDDEKSPVRNTTSTWIDVEAAAKTTSTTSRQPVSNATEKAISVQNNESTTSSSSGKSTMAGLEDKDDFPEGGLRAWLVVVGAFCGSFSVFGSKYQTTTCE